MTFSGSSRIRVRRSSSSCCRRTCPTPRSPGCSRWSSRGTYLYDIHTVRGGYPKFRGCVNIAMKISEKRGPDTMRCEQEREAVLNISKNIADVIIMFPWSTRPAESEWCVTRAAIAPLAPWRSPVDAARPWNLDRFCSKMDEKQGFPYL